MSIPAAQPFGRRGRPAGSATAPAFAARPSPQVLSPEIVAAILHAPGESDSAARPKIKKVSWSVRGAVLAGLIVGLLNAAVDAKSVLSSGDVLGGLMGTILGQAKLPVVVLLAAAGLWSGARASAFVLLFAHRLLNRFERTSYLAYVLAGGAASLLYALLASALGFGAAHHSIFIQGLSGMAAGFFYRLFAAAERA